MLVKLLQMHVHKANASSPTERKEEKKNAVKVLYREKLRLYLSFFGAAQHNSTG